MYKSKESGLTIYETLDELLSADIVNIFEYKNDYYIELQPEHFYDCRVHKVDKQTGKLSCIHKVETALIPDEERKQIDPKELRKQRAG